MTKTTKTPEAKFTAAQARAEFDKALECIEDPDKKAGLELAREYFTNPDFRKKLEQFAWDNRKK